MNHATHKLRDNKKGVPGCTTGKNIKNNPLNICTFFFFFMRPFEKFAFIRQNTYFCYVIVNVLYVNCEELRLCT